MRRLRGVGWLRLRRRWRVTMNHPAHDDAGGNKIVCSYHGFGSLSDYG
ncbi:MAG TPA: hypothetical protein VGO57_17835 [Verrucomicrobiae bacterium]